MQLDRTRIAIRERGLAELLDLALRVVMAYGPQLLLWTAVLAVPLALLNAWLMQWIVSEEYNAGTIFRYVAMMTELVFLEAPLATLATTLFLGRVMFQQPTTARLIGKDLWRFTPRILWTQLLRGTLVGLLLAMMITPDLDAAAAEWLLPWVCGYALWMRAARPFINEIILLERNPLMSSDPSTITVRRRSRSLHDPSRVDLLNRWLGVVPQTIVLTLCLTFSLWFVAGMITSQWRWGPLMVQVFVPLSLWLVVVYTAVVRFLHYLDLRIRREGWEVELKVRAAAKELEGQTA